MSTLGLDPERLQSLDDHGHHITIIPAEVKGIFRINRTWTQYVLIMIFLLIPWTEMNGAQTILLDIPRRQFALFGMTFWAHDAPLIFFILAIFTLGLTFVTAIWGRVWCGWACPQTVFIDGVFRRIEKWVEGNYIERRKLHAEKMSLKKLRIKSLKWFLFLFVSSFISHSFAAYFVGSKNLVKMVQGSPNDNWTYFLIITSMTAIVLFDFGWFREQFCIIMCPYGRFQSVLMSEDSLAVVYDAKRGEPRKGLPTLNNKQGDCVSCGRCVQVCPTGIDIRKGVQMECIACTACIDACDEIMEKVHKPKGLIKYSSVSGNPVTVKRPRTLVYVALIGLAIIGLIYNVATREPISVSVLRGKDTPYSQVKNEKGQEVILNHLKLHLKNQTFQKVKFHFSLTGELADKIDLTIVQNPVEVESGADYTLHAFVKFPPDLVSATGSATGQIKIDVTGVEKPFSTDKEFTIVGPKK